MGPGLQLRIERVGSTVTVHATGELDHEVVERFLYVVHVALEHGVPVGIDLSEVDFMDSIGLTALLSARVAGVEAGVTVRVVASSEPVARVLDLTSLREVLEQG